MSWFDEAACKGMTDVMHPKKDDSKGRERAKAICRKCPVIDQCFEYMLSLNPGEVFGIWAGTTGSDRRKLRSQFIPQRLPEHCRNGHPWEGNRFLRDGKHRCRACDREQHRNWRLRQDVA